MWVFVWMCIRELDYMREDVYVCRYGLINCVCDVYVSVCECVCGYVDV